MQRGKPLERVKGIGLKSIHDRVTLLEGTTVIETTPVEGTLITIRLPLAAHG